MSSGNSGAETSVAAPSALFWDVACLLGSFGLFFTMFCLFVRFLPIVATAEVKTVLPQADPHAGVHVQRRPSMG